jgi:hypothetical protein
MRVPRCPVIARSKANEEQSKEQVSESPRIFKYLRISQIRNYCLFILFGNTEKEDWNESYIGPIGIDMDI